VYVAEAPAELVYFRLPPLAADLASDRQVPV
jgi:hypothetical protein